MRLNQRDEYLERFDQWKLKEAIALCDDVIARFPKSLGAQKCMVLKSETQNTTIQLK